MVAEKKKQSIVLDCSVTMAWCFEDECTPFTERILEELAVWKAIVPTIWQYEVANVLLIAERHKRITKVQSSSFINALQELPISIDPLSSSHSLSTTLDLAAQSGLTVYDAAYLELAIREGVPIATLDKKIKAAAKKVKVDLLTTKLLTS